MSNRRQPQRLPPPIMHGAEAIGSEVVLQEFPDGFGMLLWKTVRAVRLWTEVSEGDRSKTFEKGAHARRLQVISGGDVPEVLRAPLAKAAAVLQPRARSATVAAACRTIAGWAESGGATGTAIEFLQAAAMSLPMDGELAYEVARVARSRSEYQRAETWFRQAVSRARRTQNRYEFARSYIGLGNVFVLRGNFPQAKRHLIRGMRAAKRFSIGHLISAAYHELAVVAMHTQSATDVHRYTRAAFDAAGGGNPKLPCLAYEYGVFLLDSGHFREALRTIASVPAEIIQPMERLGRATAVVRAAAAANDRPAYEDAWAAAERLLEDPSTASGAASALLAMARGALVAGDLERARQAAKEASRLGSARGEADVAFAASGILEASNNGGARVPGPEARPSSPRVRDLVEDIESAMVDFQPA